MAVHGIGRVPADVDATSEAMAHLEAGEIMARRSTPAPRRPIETCGVCGQASEHGAMFTTIAGSGVCDDCI